jgi:hypothetical protein
MESRREFMEKYEVGDYCFDLKRFFPDAIFSAITEVRVGSPEIILRTAAVRCRGSSSMRRETG